MKGAKKRDKKKRHGAIVLVLVVVLVLLSFQFFYNSANDGVVERSFSKNVVGAGEEITVDLDIRLSDDQTYYLFEEIIPEGFIVLGDVAKNNNIRVAKIQGAESNVFSYKVRAPEKSGTYVFSGEYAMEFLNGTLDIAGENTIRVE